jgi:hypothetical protein
MSARRPYIVLDDDDDENMNASDSELELLDYGMLHPTMCLTIRAHILLGHRFL